MEIKSKNIMLSILGVVVISSVYTNMKLDSINKQTSINNSSNKRYEQLLNKNIKLEKQVLDLKKQVLPL